MVVDNKEVQVAVTVQDVYLLTLHEPYQSPQHPVPINATIVHALTLLHPAVPQPYGGRMYRCLTEFPQTSTGLCSALVLRAGRRRVVGSHRRLGTGRRRRGPRGTEPGV
jgi:hypothetical protein